ncbi:MAG: glycosyltransferase family 2 protein [Alicyclobacillus herbarius]|uniref:glycosyltransferase n=1 Tax=Alicyclobacillus herbarius TaxID=122960 RepID=UPI0004185E76|nr:glycosyltransferase family 2 protein [Alicyclobacillus herbarius]MCL6632490.1 glycosyltransferase family 2 protein [Alicyclobacillus herbarius]
MRFSIIVPTYNERDNVRILARRIAEVLAEKTDAYELWFVDDSDDDTPEILDGLMREDPHVHVHHRNHSRGLASAVVEGFQVAAGDYLIVMDADLQHPPEVLPKVMERLLEGIDVVIPSRFVPGGSDGGLIGFRKLISWTARKMGQLALHRLRHVSDCTGGFFGIRRSVIDGVELNPVGWKILIEILAKGNYRTVHEIPYQFIARRAGESKMSLREQWNYVRHLVRLIASLPEERRFYLFCLVGLLGVVVNLCIMSLLLKLTRIPVLGASVVASVAAMLHNYVWNDRVTWRERSARKRWHKWLQLPMFMAISAVGIAITAAVAQAFSWLHLPELIGQMAGIVLATLWNFTANNRWTWAAKEGPNGGEDVPTVVSVTREKTL